MKRIHSPNLFKLNSKSRTARSSRLLIFILQHMLVRYFDQMHAHCLDSITQKVRATEL